MKLRVILEIESDKDDLWPPEVQRSADNWAKGLLEKRLSGLVRASHPITRRGRTYKAVITEIQVERDPD